MRAAAVALTAVLVCVLLPGAASGRAGMLDRRFGDGGSTQVERSSDAGGVSVALQADGRILVGGWSRSAAWAARLTPRGRLDRSFGRTGQVVIPAWHGHVAEIIALSDGRILLAGPRVNGSMVARLMPNGAIDPSFGAGGLLDVGLNYRDMALRPDGRILVAAHEFGHSGNPDSPVVAAYTADGHPDFTFDKDGVWSNPPHQLNIDAMAATPGGRIVLATSSGSQGGPGETILALRPDGTADTEWGDGGFVPGGGGPASSSDVMTEEDGSVLVLDRLENGPSLWRLRPSGERDHAFGYDSRLPLWNEAVLWALAKDQRHRVLASGMARGTLAITRSTAGGMADRDFGKAGHTVIRPPRPLGGWNASDVVSDAREGILVVGTATDQAGGFREDFGKSRPFVARIRGWGDFVSLTVRRSAPRRAIVGCRSAKPCRGVVEAFAGRRRVARRRVTVSRGSVAVKLRIPKGLRRVRWRAELVDARGRMDEAATFASARR